MLEMIDNLYVFSTSRGRFGDIIASRTSKRPVKKDLFSQLTLQKGENEFLSNAWGSEKKKLFAVMGMRDGNAVPLLFVKGFCGVETLGLAIEMLECNPIRLHRSLFCFGGTAISDLVLEQIENIFELQAQHKDKSEYLDSVCEAEALEELAPFSRLSTYEMLQTISKLVGVRIEVSEALGDYEKLGIVGQHFAGSELVGTLVILALSAREYAKDRTLSVNVQRFSDGITVSSSFIAEGNDLSRLRGFISDVADAVGIIHSTAMVGDTFRYEVLPYIPEVSFLGVKVPDYIADEIFHASLIE